MSDRHEQIAQKRAATDDEGDTRDIAPREREPVDGEQVAEGERQESQRGAGEHPFHDGDGRIPRNQAAEKNEVDRKAQLCRENEQITPDIAAVAAALRAAEHQQQRAGRAEDDTDDFPDGDRFPEVKGRNDEGQDRQACRDDRGVDRRSQAHAEDERSLVEDDGALRGEQQKQQVFGGDRVFFHEQRQNPEQDGGAQHAAIGHDHGGDDAACHDHLGNGRHDAPHGVCAEHGCMSRELFQVHRLCLLPCRKTAHKTSHHRTAEGLTDGLASGADGKNGIHDVRQADFRNSAYVTTSANGRRIFFMLDWRDVEGKSVSAF